MSCHASATPHCPHRLGRHDNQERAWDKQWKYIQVFEGHTHYIMNLVFNPKDTNTSLCLDRTVKMWSLGSSQPNFTLEAHEKGGVRYVEFHAGVHKLYLLTCGDD